MLLTFEVTNYRSFMDTTTLYFTKRSFKTNHPNNGDWSSVVNPAVGIWGPNASGKSNLLKALTEAHDAILYSFSNEDALKTLWQPHKLAAEDPVEFFIDSVVEGVRFRWFLRLGRGGILGEDLSVNESRQWKKLISRYGTEVEFGSSSGIIASARSFIREAASEWTSSVSAWLRTKNPGTYAGQFKNSIESVRPIWLGQSGIRGTQQWTVETLKNDAWRDIAGRMLDLADTGIDEVGLVEKEISPSQRDFYETMAKFMSSRIGDSESPGFEIPDTESELELVHRGDSGESFTLAFDEESDGTQAWIETAIPALFTIAEGGVLIVDEIDSSLHPVLVRQLIGLFISPDINGTGAQLLFTSHDTTLLGNFPSAVVSADSAWLTEKSGSRSALYSLDEFRISDSNNIEKRYLQGAFGAVPDVNSTLISEAFSSLMRVVSREGQPVGITQGGE